jgi:hypothetical protein
VLFSGTLLGVLDILFNFIHTIALMLSPFYRRELQKGINLSWLLALHLGPNRYLNKWDNEETEKDILVIIVTDTEPCNEQSVLTN